MRLRAALPAWLERIDWGAVGIWLLGFGLVAYLGLEGGGYDPLVYDQVGIAVWWVLLAGVAVGALPRRRLSTLAWSALALLAVFAAWTAASLIWSESGERTMTELARVAGYLGVFALALFVRGAEGGRRLAAAVAAGISLVAIVGLLSRLHPAWFPEAAQTASFLTANSERLSYPLDYWNGMGGLIAIGVPLLLYLANSAKSILVQALSAAALPALMLTAFFTLSRGGIAAAGLAVAVFLVFANDRVPRVLTLAVTGVGGTVLILAADQRQSLQDGLLNAVARDQGDELLVIAALVCLVVGLLQAGISLALERDLRPRWTVVSRDRSLAATALVALVALVVLLALGAPGRVSDAWSEFKQPTGPGEGAGRLSSAAGQSRYQYWSAAVDENSTRPLTGTGAGTFEYWWARNGDNDDTVRDAHSLYMQTLGELGIVGIALLAAFLLTILVGGVRRTLSAETQRRPLLAAALAGCVAFCLSATFDWMWQLPVLPVSMLLLAAVLVGAGPRPDRADAASLRLPQRIGTVLLALVAVVVIAIPLASTSLVRQSEADARDGDLAGALEAARSAQNAEPGAATPRLQRALILEQLGDLEAATAAARGAVDREKTNWRNWLVLSRIEAQRGRAAASVEAFREARSLNPRSPIFNR